MKTGFCRLLIFLSLAGLGPASFAQDSTAIDQIPITSSADDSKDYMVGASDVLHIEVYEDESLDGEYTVSADGTITFPLLGRLDVTERTVQTISEELTAQLERDYIYDPQVSVTIAQFRSREVKVLGNVGKPGVYFLERPTRLFSVLSRAEGLSPRFGELRPGHTARVVRAATGESIEVDLYQLLVEGQDDVNILLDHGDVVYVPETRSVHVVGEVKRPGSFPFEADLTVLKVVGLAGGATTRAAVGRTQIKRIVDGKEVTLRAKMEDLLEPDDIVEVPLSFW